MNSRISGDSTHYDALFDEEQIFSEQNYDAFIMWSQLRCEFCLTANSSYFETINLRILCENCLNSRTIASCDEFPSLRIMNSMECHLSVVCKEKAKWRCSGKINYCDTCHIRNCLILEKKDFKCKPEALFIHHSSFCVECKLIPVEFRSEDGKNLCHRCALTSLRSAAIIRIQQCKIDEFKNLLTTISMEMDHIIHMNRIQMAKLNFLKEEFQLIIKIKYAFSSNRAAIEGLQNLQSNYSECESKQEIVEKINEFMNKQSLFLNLIGNNQIDCEDFGQIVQKIKDKVRILNESFMVPILNCELEMTPFSCSQNSSESYATHLHDTDASVALVSSSFDQKVRQTAKIQNTQLHPDGELIDFPSQEEVQTTLIFFRDPFWMFMVIPGQEQRRQGILSYIQNITEPIPLNSESIKLDTEVLFKDSREFPDEYPLKRAIIIRLPSRPGGTYCCQSLDFGYKLAKGIQFLFKVPPELVGKSPTVFKCKMMGIKPVSGFTFTQALPENACSVMRRLAKITNYKVFIRRCFKVPDKYDTIFCKVVSAVGRTRIDWSEKLISSRVAIEFKDSNQCFRPRKDYCYLHHILNGCIPSECYKNHSCPFCPDNENSHRLRECQAYIEAEKQLLLK